QGPGVGLLVLGAPGFGHVVRDWFVLPIDAETGELEEAQRLFGSDLEGEIPRRCQADDNGWVVDTALSLPPATRVSSMPAVSLSSIELRLRLEPGSICVESMAARGEGLGASGKGESARHEGSKGDVVKGDGAKGEVASVASIPLMVTDRSTGRRWELRC